MGDAHETSDKNIELWKIKKLIKGHETVKGNGTSMISLIIPLCDKIPRVMKMLSNELVSASNMKSRVNRQFVQVAITSAQQQLKVYNKVPPSGLILFTVTIVTKDGKKKRSITLTCQRNTQEEGNQLFDLITLDKKHAITMLYTKTAELAKSLFINPATNQPSIKGLIHTGSADFKTRLSELDLVRKYFGKFNQDTGKYVVGVEDTLKALEMRAVRPLIVWENQELNKYVLKNSKTDEIVMKHFNKKQKKMSLLAWFAGEYKCFGCALEFVKSQDRSQFYQGIGSIGGLLRY
ncbi:hypothetical protein C1H46_042182 [Malus baccata]|uniref:eRF1/Pelota-like N-terminal domain-containing protein n=1 Tax=Malus baccata TaxID=106549 RepID=A0A540KDG8_MALBA|nr:hypothetical protein C1H46_042182 [Malus baccata]